MEPVGSQARSLASGTLATLTGLSRYDQIDPVRAAFIRFVDEAEDRTPGTYRAWPDAWLAFKSSPAYPLAGAA